jgi:hypothetical protein
MTEGLFGIKMGERFRKWAIFGKIRPGFIYYQEAMPGGGIYTPWEPDALRVGFRRNRGTIPRPQHHLAVRRRHYASTVISAIIRTHACPRSMTCVRPNTSSPRATCRSRQPTYTASSSLCRRSPYSQATAHCPTTPGSSETKTRRLLAKKSASWE